MTQASPRSPGDIAALVAAMKRRQLLSSDQKSPFFFQIGESFTVGDDAWTGPAIASGDALFLLRETKTREGLNIAGVSSDTNLSMCSKELLTIEYADIPSAITSDPSWKMLVKNPCQVSVLLRDEVRTVALVPFTSDIEIASPYPLIRVCCDRIAPGDAEARLRNSGWSLSRKSAPGKAEASVRNSGWLLSRLVPQTGAVAVVTRSRRTPVVVGLCVLVFVALTVAIVRSDSLSVLASMMLCLPLLGGLVAFLVWYFRLSPDGRD